MARTNGKDAQLGKLLEQFFRARAKRLKADAAANKLADAERELAEQCKQELLTAKVEKAQCRLGTFSVKRVKVPRVSDWERFYSWILRAKHPEVLFRRLSEQSFNDVLDHDEKLKKRGVPGVEYVDVVKVSPTTRR